MEPHSTGASRVPRGDHDSLEVRDRRLDAVSIMCNTHHRSLVGGPGTVCSGAAHGGVKQEVRRVGESRPDPTPAADFEELAEAVDNYRRAHPEVDDALRIFEVSEQAYQAALEAMYGPRVSWSNAANPSAG